MKKAQKKHQKHVEDHVYEDIINAEEHDPHLLLQPERFRERLGGYTGDDVMVMPTHQNRKMSEPWTRSRNLSPTYHGDSSKANPRLLSEKMSKDSGLSSGSSSASHNRLLRSNGDLNVHESGSKHSYRTEREAMKKNMLDKDVLEEFDLYVPQTHLKNDLEIEVRLLTCNFIELFFRNN